MIVKRVILVFFFMVIFLTSCKKDSVNTQNDVETINLGLLLGIASYDSPSQDEDYSPLPLSSSYKSIWIALDDKGIHFNEKDGFLIAHGENGFYKYINHKFDDSAKDRYYVVHYNKVLSNKIGQEQPSDFDIALDAENYLIYYSEFDNLLYVGNQFSIIYTQRIYTSGAGGYQYIPTINILKIGDYQIPWWSNGSLDRQNLYLINLFSDDIKKSIENQIERYKTEYDKTVSVESDMDKQYISEENLSLERRDGQWRLMVPIMFSNWKESHNYITDFLELECDLPKSIVPQNEKIANWDDIKAIERNLVDALISPDENLIVVQTDSLLKIYRYKNGELGDLELEIPVKHNDRIILNQWVKEDEFSEWNSKLKDELN